MSGLASLAHIFGLGHKPPAATKGRSTDPSGQDSPANGLPGMQINPTVPLDPSQIEDRRPGIAPPVGNFDLINAFLSLRSQLGNGPTPTVTQAKPMPLAAQFSQMRQASPTGSGTYADWVHTVAKLKGLTPDEERSFYALGMGESTGRNIPQQIVDINSKNGTPAFGPWQVIGPTFQKYMEPGYTDLHDPIASGLASINYQRARYGRILSKPGY